MNHCTPKLCTVSLVLAGTILAGCQPDKGSDLKAEVDRLNSLVAELQAKLAVAEKAAGWSPRSSQRKENERPESAQGRRRALDVDLQR